MSPSRTWSISQLADELGVTTRSIRFYEEKGLVKPERTQGGYRVYNKRDRARLKLILRGKRFGLSLDECAEILGLASVDMDETEQIKQALAAAEGGLDELSRRKRELLTMERDLEDIFKRLRDRLAELNGAKVKKGRPGKYSRQGE